LQKKKKIEINQFKKMSDWKGEEEFNKELTKLRDTKPPVPASKINKIAKLATSNAAVIKKKII
jgi:hypothetical protein